MVEKFDCNCKEPVVYGFPEITLRSQDTLVVEFDQDIWSLDEAEQLMNFITKLYPKNKIMTTFKGMKIGVIHNVDD